jgi:hypothetical protein
MTPDTNDVHDPKLQMIVHHHCKGYDDGTFVCLMSEPQYDRRNNSKTNLVIRKKKALRKGLLK